MNFCGYRALSSKSYFRILVKKRVMLENPKSSLVAISEVWSVDICDKLWLILPNGVELWLI